MTDGTMKEYTLKVPLYAGCSHRDQYVQIAWWLQAKHGEEWDKHFAERRWPTDPWENPLPYVFDMVPPSGIDSLTTRQVTRENLIIQLDAALKSFDKGHYASARAELHGAIFVLESMENS